MAVVPQGALGQSRVLGGLGRREPRCRERNLTSSRQNLPGCRVRNVFHCNHHFLRKVRISLPRARSDTGSPQWWWCYQQYRMLPALAVVIFGESKRKLLWHRCIHYSYSVGRLESERCLGSRGEFGAVRRCAHGRVHGDGQVSEVVRHHVAVNPQRRRGVLVAQ